MADNWQPSADLKQIRQRARLYSTIRQFFAERDVMEVETPVLSQAAVSDPHLYPLKSTYEGPGSQQPVELYLQTSPEYPMKRLLAAGSGPIYQLCKSFRNGESGRRHNPEFTMLEWYRPGFDDRQLMSEIADLLNAVTGSDSITYLSYRQAFLDFLKIDPHFADVELLQSLAIERLDFRIELDSRDGWLELLFSHLIEPQLVKPTFVFDYPASQAALAQVAKDELGIEVAKRFELFVRGVELANGYLELTDGAEQLRRFQKDQETRQKMGLEPLPIDENLVGALKAGMPDCAGVALGVDRLLMISENCQHIDEVLAFPIQRA